jgi:enoyl-CoA hydratase/carnithine racemase
MGKRINAGDALRINLVNKVVPLSNLMTTAKEWANQISEFNNTTFHLVLKQWKSS